MNPVHFRDATGIARRRGAALLLTLVVLVTLLGFAALTIDVGAIYNTRADLQNAADAAALAGNSALSSDAMLQARLSNGATASIAEVEALILERTTSVGLLNGSFGSSGTVIDPQDVIIGWIDLDSSISPISSAAPAHLHNAVQVVARRTGESPNGPLRFFFASIFGKARTDVTASAVAAFDDRVAGYDTQAGGADFWPFSLDVMEYDNQLAAGADIYDYDTGAEDVLSGSDGTPEVNIYPAKLAPGNFGLLNIGKGNNGASNLADDIEDGVSPDDLEREIGTSELEFYDADGLTRTYNISGNPGLKASLEKSIKTRIGDVVAVPVHDQVTGNGANTTYRITGIRFVRVMDAKLQGATSSRGVWVQPVTYTGGGVLTSPDAPSSGGAAGKMVLVR